MQPIELDRSRFPALWEVLQPPEKLYALAEKGALDRLEELPARGLAVVGTRRAQPRALDFVKASIARLAHARIIVISGLARGIDAAAHEAALNVGLPTVAVLGAGVDIVYPPENSALRARILAAGGVLVSEFAPGEAPRAGQFIQRNRLIAGWAKATWVVQAPLRSGALSTAAWARKQERHCFATPVFPGDPGLAGNSRLFETDPPAEPFFGPHSLDVVWPELRRLAPVLHPASKHSRKPELTLHMLAPETPEAREERALERYVHGRTSARGGALVPDALSWATSQNWEPHQFFVRLQALLLAGRILDRGAF